MRASAICSVVQDEKRDGLDEIALPMALNRRPATSQQIQLGAKIVW
jgi:hypothetical protein